MVKKLKGKATEELKGEKKRKRMKEYEEAERVLKKYAPYILGGFLLLFIYFTYKMFYNPNRSDRESLRSALPAWSADILRLWSASFSCVAVQLF